MPMKKPQPIWMILAIVAVAGVIVLMVVNQVVQRQRSVPAETEARRAVKTVLAPRERVGTVTLPAVLTVKASAVPAVGVGETEGSPSPVAGAEEETRVVVGRSQVLAVVNGVAVTGEMMMPAGRFKEGKETTMPEEVYKEVLERAINRELIFSGAQARGLELGEEQLKQLEGVYGHLTSNPLNVAGGGEPLDLHAGGSATDMLFHVRDKAARLLQVEMLKGMGMEDTAEGRRELAEQLRRGATIQTASVAQP